MTRPTRLPVGRSGGARAISSVAAPLRSSGRAHSLAQVLQIALAQAGLCLGYDAVMGLSGLAFRTPELTAPAPGVEDSREALTALGHALESPLDLHGADGPLAHEQALELVAANIDRGLPCIALGWGSVKQSWSIICGYDRARERLLGHCVLDAPRREYESWPPTVELLAILPDRPRPHAPDALPRAVRARGETWQRSGEARYAAWIAAIEASQGPVAVAQIAAVELLADARNAAAAFLSALAERCEAIPAAWLRSAAERYRGLVERLEAADVPRTAEVLALLDEPQVRREWAEVLRGLMEVEAAAAADLRMAFVAQHPPEVDGEW